MQGLWLLAKVPHDKRQEMIQSLSAFIAASEVRPFRRFILQDFSDDSLIGWLGYWRTPEALEQFLESPTYHALKGAAETLGRVEEIQRLSLQSLVPEPSTSKGDRS